MQKKILLILEITVILGLSIFYVVHDVVPEYKEKLGSSDKFINTSDYRNMIEVRIDSKVRFLLVLNSEKKIYHIIFLSNEAMCLYNQNIESNDLSKGVSQIVRLLVEDERLTSTSSIEVTRYEDKFYQEFIGLFKKSLLEYGIGSLPLERSKSFSELAVEVGMDSQISLDEFLRELDYKSKEVFSGSSTSSEKSEVLNETNGNSFTNKVYKKLEEYVFNNNIKFMDKNNKDFLISMVAADTKKRYFPTANSWYYVSDGKVYAYIELVSGEVKVGYCYSGSIDALKKGEC